MDTYAVAKQICERWREIWPVDNPRLPVAKQGVICPLCGSGSGKHKSGVKEVPWQGRHRLKCFGKCGFYGDAINLLGLELGLTPQGRGFIAILEEGLRRLPIKPSDVAPVVNKGKRKFDFSAFYKVAQTGLKGAKAFLMRRGISICTAQKCGCGYVENWVNPENGKTKSPRFIIPCNVHNYFARDTRPQEGICPKIHIGSKTIFDPLHALGSDGVVFVVEGGIDALAVIDAGGAAVALMGCDGRPLLEAAQKADFGGIFALALDSDDAGRIAERKLQEQLSATGFSFGETMISSLAADPAEAHQKCPELFQKMILPGK